MTEKDNDHEFISLRDASEYAKVTRQAIYVAIKKKKLTAVKRKGKWCIYKKDLHYYQLHKYDRNLRVEGGERVFNRDEGIFSITDACLMISTELKQPYSLQHLYYLVRSGQLKAFKKGYSWIVSREDITQLILKERGHVEGQTEMEMK